MLQVREMAVEAPRLVMDGKGQVKLMRFALLEEMGFTTKEMRGRSFFGIPGQIW